MTKQPKQYETIEGQIEILKGHGCIISDISFARETLSKINYYRLIAYLLPFKNGKNKEKITTFEKIVSLHEFDRKLRSLLLQVIDRIELTLRTRLASRIADLNTENFLFEDTTTKQIYKKAAESYCKKKNNQCHINVPHHKVYKVYTKTSEEIIFKEIIQYEVNKESQPLLLCKKENIDDVLVAPIDQQTEQRLKQTQKDEKITLNKDDYKKKVKTKEQKKEELIAKIEKIKKQNNEDRIVIYHKEHYDSELPLRVIIEFFTFGDLSRLLYKNLKPADKKKIARQFIPKYIIPDKDLHEYLESWLHCCTDLRNRCAHFGVLYNHVFTAEPKDLKPKYHSRARSLWILILVIKWLYPFQDEWDKEFFSQIENLVNDSKLEDSDLNNYGFPIKTWKEDLKKPKKESLYSWICLENICLENRRKFIIGSIVMKEAKNNPFFAQVVETYLKKLTREKQQLDAEIAALEAENAALEAEKKALEAADKIDKDKNL